MPTSAPDWVSCWQQLDAWLHQHHSLWQSQPFSTPSPDWAERYPELAAWLEQLDDATCQHYEEQPDELIQPLMQWLPTLAQRQQLLMLPELTGTTDCSLPENLAKAMPGRKRQQAGAFAGAILPLQTAVFDWCCGSGHLARTLAPHTHGSVTGLEWDKALVQKGNQLAQAAGDAVQIRQQDVMQLGDFWPVEPHGVALHACGDLHRQLIHQAISRHLSRLSLSPCCYHLIQQPQWQPLSQQAKNSRLQGLDRTLLRLAVQETVTAPERVTRQRDQLNLWRLAFDGLQRQLRGQEHYLPLPSVSPTLLQGRFTDFCRWAAAEKQLNLPVKIDEQQWLAYGKQRLQQVQRHELLRHLFRRPLELWLVLDYVLTLQEAGYQVRLGTFCNRQLTPRNLLIDARFVDMGQIEHHKSANTDNTNSMCK
ncbi:MAG: methyltransferase [Marinospirillum sp.]|uniref:methyltransferase n=1 Tax=Marinospirillum sp. TaxID=2183934 RepID=UPI0019E58585|nr:methyltransferase [Marinospirillum sp.]MBE0508515.1 methyltransferase [Marinospirillum sp.]